MQIPEIKTRLSILTVVEHYGHTPNRSNLIHCPFHQDDRPSLQLYPKTNTWHCFGCNKGTDQMDFIRYKENCNPHEAIMKAKELLNVRAIFTVARDNQSMSEKQEHPPLTQQERINALTTAFTYFARSLQSRDEKPRNYLKKRSLDWNKITVGYDGHNFHKSKEVTEELRKLYLSTGLIYPDKLGRTNNYHSFFDGCIVFPIVDEQGKIVNLYGRHIEKDEHRYLPGEHQGIYPHYPKATTEILIITEAIIDCATLLQLPEITGKYELMSLYGTNNFKSEHEKAIAKLHDLKEVIFFYDGDKAGRDAIEKHAVIIKELNPKTCTERPVLSGAKGSRSIRISYVETPDNEDINGLAQGHEAGVFTELINDRKIFHSQERKVENEKPALSGLVLSEAEAVEVTSEGENGNEKNNGQSPNDPVTINDAKHKIANDSMTHDPTTCLPAEALAKAGKLFTNNRDHITYETELLTITLMGGVEYYNLKRLKVTLHIQLKSNFFKDYRDTVDLYSHSQRKRLMQEVSEELEISTSALSQTITDLTNQLEKYRQQKREAERKKAEAEKNKDREIFTQEQMQSGETFLRNKELMNQTYNRIKQIGLIGQEKNGMLLFFIYLTRLFKEPLHALVQGKSGSGKTYLLKKIIGFVPKSHYRNITAITENALYHVLEGLLSHIILLLEDLEGSYSALLAIRELMTNLSIRKWTTITNPRTGIPEQKELFVEGPVCIAGATTQDNIYEDNANRSFQIQIEEKKEQEAKVLDYQRKEAAGLIDKTIEENTQTIFKTAQLQLKPVEVIIPFADQLKLPEYIFKKQRTNKHYLTLIKSVAFWNQKQRQWKRDKNGNHYIEATLEDVGWANYMSKESLLRKSDELSPEARSFFEGLKIYVKKELKENFSTKEIIKHFRLYPMKVNRYLRRELEPRGLIKRTGGNFKTGFEYAIAVWDDYEQLKKGVDVLDELLKGLQQKHRNNGSITAQTPSITVKAEA